MYKKNKDNRIQVNKFRIDKSIYNTYIYMRQIITYMGRQNNIYLRFDRKLNNNNLKHC